MAPRTGGSGLTAQRTRLLGAVTPVVTRAGYDLEDLNVSRAGRRSVVRIVVDGDTGVNLDTVAELSRAISTALDDSEQVDGPLGWDEYTLEVTSPGVDRPLTQPRHWRRNVGRLVRVRAGGQTVTGRVTASDDAGIELEVAGAVRRYPHPELGPGKVQLEFGRDADEPRDADGAAAQAESHAQAEAQGQASGKAAEE
jgi:ribosome maturation factor RimP